MESKIIMTLTELLENIKATLLPTEAQINQLIYLWKVAETKTKNDANALDYETDFDEWLKNRDQCVANGLPIKPAPTPELLLKVTQGADGLPLFSAGPEFCVALNPIPPLPVPPDPNVLVVRVGDRYPGTDIWRMLAGDTAPLGYETMHQGQRLRKKITMPPHGGHYRLVR